MLIRYDKYLLSGYTVFKPFDINIYHRNWYCITNYDSFWTLDFVKSKRLPTAKMNWMSYNINYK